MYERVTKCMSGCIELYSEHMCMFGSNEEYARVHGSMLGYWEECVRKNERVCLTIITGHGIVSLTTQCTDIFLRKR